MMHSTPSNGFHCCTETNTTGHDIERLKDRAEDHGERITRGEERIKCLDMRVGRLECGLCSKPLPACKPGGTPCLDTLRQHLADPDAHEGLLERKVDKRDGFGLISDDCLSQI